MNRKLLIALTASTALVAPLAAQAQTASSTVTINGNVDQACVIGQPTLVTLALGTLTGSDGKITSALASSNVARSTEIPTAWCNTPSKLTLDGSPMALTPTPAYSTPSGFARLVTYDAKLTGWSGPVTDRPLVNDPAETVATPNPYASPLNLAISRLAALDAAGQAENASAVLEAGAYSGSVTISVSVQ